MDSKSYIEAAKKTESTNFSEIKERLSDTSTIRLLHAAMGVSTESGELLDALKKSLFYGKELDRTNLFEEVGDLLWYLAILADEIGFDFEQAMAKNVEKLRARYGERFSSLKATKRNLAEERKILDS